MSEKRAWLAYAAGAVVLSWMTACAPPGPGDTAGHPETGLLADSAEAARRGISADTGLSTSSSSSVVAWSFAGPGGMGAMSAVDARVDASGTTVLAGGDVGGIYRSTDSGATWTSPQYVKVGSTDYRNPQEVHDFAYAGSTRYAATAEGLFDQKIWETDWEHVAAFFDPVTGAAAALSTENDGDDLQRSIQVVEADPTNQSMLWIGMGRAYTPFLGADPITYRERSRTQEYKIYRYDSSAGTLDGMLKLDEATVFAFAVHPSDGNTVWAATNRGLYYTWNAGSTWLEIGKPTARYTINHGDTWATCAPADPNCPFAWRVTSGVSCSDTLETCLPVNGETEVNEDSVNVRDVEYVPGVDGLGRLFVTVWDRGHANSPSGVPACAGTPPPPVMFDDNTHDFWRGGVWVSRGPNVGMTWDWMLEDDPAWIGGNYRCNEELEEDETDDGGEQGGYDYVTEIEVDPLDEEHLLVGVYGDREGVWERKVVSGTPTWFRRTGTSAPMTWETGGAHGYGIGGGTVGPSVYDLDVAMWNAGTLQRTTGYVSHSRGVLKFESSLLGWSYENLGHDLSGATSPPTWAGEALDDTCALAFDDDGEYIWLGAADGGVFRSDDNGDTWQRMSENWSTIPGDAMNSYAVVVDREQTTPTVYASSSIGEPGPDTKQAVLRSTDSGATWTVIGGDDDTGTDLNGFATDRNVRAMAIIYEPSTPSANARRLLAGTEGDGLWYYKPAAGWSQVGVGCPTTDNSAVVHSIVTSASFPDVAYVTFDTESDLFDGDLFDGIYRVSLTDPPTCSRQEDPSSPCVVCNPEAVTVAENSGQSYLIAAGLAGGYAPRVWRRIVNHPADQPSLDWHPILDPGPELDPDDVWTDLHYNGTVPRRVFSDLTTHPGASFDHVVVAVLRGQGAVGDGRTPTQIFSSADAGATFSRDDNLGGDLPTVHMYGFAWDSSGADMYALTRCNSLWTAPDPQWGEL